jgi:glycosyltransferase involved in cell wall biosynthesis
MKVLHLASHDESGGAARAAYRQHMALLAAGVDSQMLVRFKEGDEDRVSFYQPTAAAGTRVRRLVRRARLGLAGRQFTRRGGVPHVSLTDDRSDLAEDILAGFTPDVVNLHFVANFIDFPSFFRRYAQQVPLVVTMHDQWTFTGGCHYAGDCKHYQKECGHCPILDSNREMDASREIWERKSAAFAQVPSGRLAFVADSLWLADKARSSGLLRNQRVESIHYGLNTQFYRPGSQAAAREALGIPASEKVILFGAANLDDPRKGFRQLRAAIEGSPLLRDGFYLSVGRGHVRFPTSVKHLHLGQIQSDVLLAAVYRAADVFVMPSLEEAFGQTALEAVACGTPVAAFASGGIPEILVEGVNGKLCPTGNVDALRQAIEQLIGDGSMRSSWLRQATAFIESRFSFPINAGRYLALYRELAPE